MKRPTLDEIKEMVDENFETINGRLVKKDSGEPNLFILDHMDLLKGGFKKGELSIIPQPHITTCKTTMLYKYLTNLRKKHGYEVAYFSLENTDPLF
jgi:hypothetical protein